MSFNGSGVFVINSSGQPVSANTLIEASVFNAFTADVATGLSTAITKDGQSTVTANLPMAGFKFTGLGAGSAVGNSLRYEQLFSTSAVTLLGAMNWVKGADIASDTTINLTTATGNAVHVTGTTAITTVTLGSGMWRMVIFDGALTLTHSATTNNLPGGANITTAANDRALYWSDGTTVYCAAYTKANGKPVIAPAVGDVTGLGTGVATALAVNVGSAGAPVVFNGALGTPASGNLANCTGAPAAVGSVVQVVEATPYVTYSSSATTIPYDDSIPQNTEGAEWNTVTITPINASNRLRIEVNYGTVFNASTAEYLIAAIFQDSTANAIAANVVLITGNSPNTINVVYEMAAGTTSATTFKTRAGFASSTIYVNGNASTRVLGGVSAVRMRVTEIKV
jgi:hypothetical protein